MRLDVVDLNRFYATPMGEMAQSMVARRLNALWPDASGLDMAGIGYASPYLEAYRGSARRLAAAMPADQGVEAWTGTGGTASALVDETALPFRDNAFDRVILAHALEDSDALRPLLREAARILAPEGRAILIAPSRVSLWSLSDVSPFGHGRPFTRIQLGRLLRQAGLEPTAWSRALYAPPLRWGVVTKSAMGWERAGELIWPSLGGVILAEARKRRRVPPGKGTAPVTVFAPARA